MLSKFSIPLVGLGTIFLPILSIQNSFCYANSNSQNLLLISDVKSEAEAREILAPLMDTVKKIHVDDIEYLVSRGWWDLATEIVAKGHEQKADVSFAVRKAVKGVKNKADELVRSLNPKYHQKQQVTPVYRWAQNSTSIFLTIKYSVKWDAPGAVNVKDPKVTMTDGLFSFRATGEHSGNRYEYMLDIDLFDQIIDAESSWSAASVGRFTAVLAKKRSRKWPRLLLDKKNKGTGRLDLTRQEEVDKESGSSGFVVVSQSERTCFKIGKIYCPKKDVCLSDCTNSTSGTTLKDNFCTGPPADGPKSVSFSDNDMRRGYIGGIVTIDQQDMEYDIMKYQIYIGKTRINESERQLSDFGAEIFATVVGNLRKNSVTYELKNFKKIECSDTEVMAIAIVTENDSGVYDKPYYKTFIDAFLPNTGPYAAKFEDTDGDVGKISGEFVIDYVKSDDTIDEFVLYWGKKSGRKLQSDNYIGIAGKASDTDPISKYKFENKSVPSGATHILVFAKNTHGENTNSNHVLVHPIVDNTKPCAGKSLKNSDQCPPAIESITENTSEDKNLLNLQITLKTPTVKQTTGDGKNLKLVVYASTGEKHHGESNYKELKIDEYIVTPTMIQLNNAKLNEEAESWRYTHLQVYTQNAFGRSKYCSSVRFAETVADSEGSNGLNVTDSNVTATSSDSNVTDTKTEL